MNTTPGKRDSSRLGEGQQPRLSRRLLQAARPQPGHSHLPIGELIENLGEGSFGWCLLVFAVVNLMPMPVGSNLITALPLLALTVQMAIGWDYVHLPRFIARREIHGVSFRRGVVRARPLFIRLERVVRPRHRWVFAPAYHRLTGIALFIISFALFLPIPLSGWVSAGALFAYAVGLIADDGLVALGGLVLGALAITVTTTMGTLLILGFKVVM